jgi:hypothetical protein
MWHGPCHVWDILFLNPIINIEQQPICFRHFSREIRLTVQRGGWGER